VQPAVRLSSADLAETLGGGQAFRWRRRDDDEQPYWRGQWGGQSADLRVRGGWVEHRGPEALAQTAPAAVARYLAVGTDWVAVVDGLPWRSDPCLRAALAEFPGLRILRQPFGEALLNFLCSATKQIPQISAMAEAMAERLGAPIPGGGWALPDWDRLAETPEAELRACGLGFRARYVAATAAWLAARPGWLEQTEALPYGEARERLQQLPGVGGKIADCVLLFGAGRLEAFPVDTWILQALARRYGLTGWAPEALATFGRVHFGSAAGYAQQVLFATERRDRRADKPKAGFAPLSG